MKNVKKFLFNGALILILSIFSVGCSNDSDTNYVPGTSKLKVTMTDAPGDYDEVNIDVIGIKIKSNADTGESGWVSLEGVNEGVYNLLDLTGGVTTVLTDTQIPSGFVGQIRLVLGENNTVVKDGISYPLSTPSAMQSGLKLQINQLLLPDVAYNFLIDFDVSKSIVIQAGSSGIFNLKPVIRLTSQAVSGSIKGTVVNAGDFQVEASVMVNDQKITAFTNEEGVFFLHGIPSGNYAVTLTPDPASEKSPVTIENVIVVIGETTDMGDISL